MLSNYIKRYYKWIVASLILIFGSSILFYPIPVLSLNDVKRDTGLIIILRRENGFTYEYTHSVQKTKVQEHFVFAPDKQIVLTSSTFQSLGVGLPFLPSEGKLINDQGVFVLTEINRIFPTITIGFMPIAKQSILLHDKSYLMEDYFIEGAFVKIAYEKMLSMEILKQKWSGGKKVLHD